MKVNEVSLRKIMIVQSESREGKMDLVGDFEIRISEDEGKAGNPITVSCQIDFEPSMPLQDAIRALTDDAIARLSLSSSIDPSDWGVQIFEANS